MNKKVWYLPYFKGVYHTRMIETFSNANARMVRMVHTMLHSALQNKPEMHMKMKLEIVLNYLTIWKYRV